MAYNFDNGFFHQQITKYAREVFKTPPSSRYCTQFRPSAGMRRRCQLHVCCELREFYMSFTRLGGRFVDSWLTTQLFDAFCNAFHGESEGKDSVSYQWWCSFFVANIPPPYSSVEQEFVRLMAHYQTNRSAVRHVGELLFHQRNNPRVVERAQQSPRARVVEDSPYFLSNDLIYLELAAEQLIAYWDKHWEEILDSCLANIPNWRHNTLLCNSQRYFRTNIRCRIINYAREHFHTMDPQTRTAILQHLTPAKTIFDILPLFGYDALLHPDAPVDRCISKGANNCCAVQETMNSKYPSKSHKLNNRLIDEYAVSDLCMMVYRSCLKHEEVANRPRMRYTQNFVDEK